MLFDITSRPRTYPGGSHGRLSSAGGTRCLLPIWADNGAYTISNSKSVSVTAT